MFSHYPLITKFIDTLQNPSETFLFERTQNLEYPFWPEFEYLLLNRDRFFNYESILNRLSVEAPLSLEVGKAWELWRKFRSAQFEVAAIFLIERYFSGEVLEIIPEGTVPTSDFKIRFNRCELKVEAKAQSGQQHGDKHPSENGAILFDPKDENDLRSWLFEEKVSSRSRRAMQPMALVAENKGADILVCQTDYIATTSDVMSQVSIFCPQISFVKKIAVYDNGKNPISITFFQAEYPCKQQLNILKEIWLYNFAHLDRFIVLFQQESKLLNHLKHKR